MDTSILPAEIWDDIFSECENAPLSLSQICSHLRATVHANAKLWSVTTINIYKRGLWGGLHDDAIYVRREQADSISQSLRLSGTHPITVILTASGLMSRLKAFELAEYSRVFPLVRSALGRCREFKIEAFAGDAFSDAIYGLLRGVALPILWDVSLYGLDWDGSRALELLLTGAAHHIRRIYFSETIFHLPLAYLKWARTVHEFQLCRNWFTLPLAEQFPNISNLSIVAGTKFDRMLQDHVGLRRTVAGLRHLTSFSLYISSTSHRHILEALKIAAVEFPTLEKLSVVNLDPAVSYHVDESSLDRLIHRASLTTLCLLGIPFRNPVFLNLLRLAQSSLRVLIISEPIDTPDSDYPISPAFINEMHDESFLPQLTALHLVWNHAIDEKAVVDMLEQRAFEAVAVGRGVPLEGMEEEVKRRVLRLNIAYPPVLRAPYGSEKP